MKTAREVAESVWSLFQGKEAAKEDRRQTILADRRAWIGQLRESSYLTHRPDCYMWADDAVRLCTCGLDAAIDEILEKGNDDV